MISRWQIKGSATFSMCVKDMMPLDVADHFRGTVSVWATVTSGDGGRQTTFDDSTPVHKQLIDIKYSKDTRKQFKPGLPYKGTVRAAIGHREFVLFFFVCHMETLKRVSFFLSKWERLNP